MNVHSTRAILATAPALDHLEWLARGIVLACFLCFVTTLSGAQHGLFTYEPSDSGIRITDYPIDAVGAVEIPGEIDEQPVTAIYGSAFEGCRGLTSVSLPPSLTSIGYRAFADCSGLTEFHIPANVSDISDHVWSGCRQLLTISVEGGNTHYRSLDGILFDATLTTLLRFPEGRAGSYAIPEGVTKIDYRAFVSCSLLTELALPASLEAGTMASSGIFDTCTALESFTVAPDHSELLGIDGAVFTKDRIQLLRYPTGKPGPFEIPEGVIAFSSYISPWGRSAFFGCLKLTSIHLPASLIEELHGGDFRGCRELESITVASDNPQYSSFEGVLFDRERTRLIACPEGKSGPYTIPQGVTVTGRCLWSWAGSTCGRIGAFQDCRHLTSITFPRSFTRANGPFSGCTSLSRATFLGDAPNLGSDTFYGTHRNFTVYFLEGGAGFTSPTWHGRPIVMIREADFPAARWLLVHGLPHDADLHQDANGDGVNLLMAYALGLDPRRNLRHRLPVPRLDGNNLSLRYHATSPGITYRVKTSTDLRNWTPGGVVTSGLDQDGFRTASVPRDNGHRFLRLVVE